MGSCLHDDCATHITSSLANVCSDVSLLAYCNYLFKYICNACQFYYIIIYPDKYVVLNLFSELVASKVVQDRPLHTMISLLRNVNPTTDIC